MPDHNPMNLDIENDIYNEQVLVERHILKNTKIRKSIDEIIY
jgi:hypothetical protein